MWHSLTKVDEQREFENFFRFRINKLWHYFLQAMTTIETAKNLIWIRINRTWWGTTFFKLVDVCSCKNNVTCHIFMEIHAFLSQRKYYPSSHCEGECRCSLLLHPSTPRWMQIHTYTMSTKPAEVSWQHSGRTEYLSRFWLYMSRDIRKFSRMIRFFLAVLL